MLRGGEELRGNDTDYVIEVLRKGLRSRKLARKIIGRENGLCITEEETVEVVMI